MQADWAAAAGQHRGAAQREMTPMPAQDCWPRAGMSRPGCGQGVCGRPAPKAHCGGCRCPRVSRGCCRACGHDLSGAPEVGREHRQVFDIPPISVRVTEHQMLKRRCECGTVTSAPPPAGVTAPVQYGTRSRHRPGQRRPGHRVVLAPRPVPRRRGVRRPGRRQPATGQQRAHRAAPAQPGRDRALNRALHTIAVTRMRSCPTT